MGDIANLMYCSSCGEHYHGTCVGLAQLPGKWRLGAVVSEEKAVEQH